MTPKKNEANVELKTPNSTKLNRTKSKKKIYKKRRKMKKKKTIIVRFVCKDIEFNCTSVVLHWPAFSSGFHLVGLLLL